MTTMNSPSAPQKPKLLDRVRGAIRARHYSRRTEDAYLGWIKRCIYREVLQHDLPCLEGVVRAKRPIRLPVVLTREEVQAVLAHLRGTPWLMGTLLYGAGLRLLPACRARGAGRESAQLRVKDVDFGLNQIVVRNGKGQKDRVTLLPATVKPDLARHLEAMRQQHQRDLTKGAGWVELPGGLERKYPNAGREWAWHWVFPATSCYLHRETGKRRRHHLHESVIQRAVKEAVRRAGIAKLATPHTFRHSGVYPALCGTTHLLEDGYDIRLGCLDAAGHRASQIHSTSSRASAESG